MSIIISSGDVESGIILENDTMTVLDGGVATDTTVNSGGGMDISSGGTATTTTVNSGGNLYVEGGGTANSTTVNLDGRLNVSSGGTATQIMENGGYVYVTNGADTVFASNVFSGLVINHASATVHSGTTANSTTLTMSGCMYVYSGGTVNNTTVGFRGSIYVSSGGMANNTTVNSRGYFNVSSGVTANSTTVNSYGSVCVSSGGKANNTTVSFRGSMYVSSGGVANNTTVNSSGRLEVSSGGMANNTTVNSSGRLEVSSGGIANNTMVNSRGYLIISSGGTANNTTVNSSGFFNVSSGGTANSTMVNSYGSMYVVSGGTATEIVWTPCEGRVYVSEGGYATFVSEYSGVYFGSDNHLLSNVAVLDSMTLSSSCEMNVMRGGTANSTTVNSSGRLYVSSGGTANSTTVNSFGWLYVSSGGTANSITVNSFGWLYVSSGGTANSTMVNSYGSMYVVSGGTATEIVWTPCEGHVYVSEGGYATFVSEYSGVYFGSDNHLLSNVAVMDGMTISSSCEMNIMRGGTANNITVNSSGQLFVSSGGTANSTTIISSGRIYVAAGGTMNNTTINSYGRMDVVFGGTANNTTVINWGDLYVDSDGTVNNTTINFAGRLHILSGTANSTTVNSSGYLSVASGTANSTTVINAGILYVASGGTANSTTVNSSGWLEVTSGGTANSTTVNSSGYLSVASGCLANNTTVYSGGRLSVRKGGKVTGEMVFESGAEVSAYEGAIFDFDLTQTEAGSEALVNDLSIIQGAPLYTLTVDGSQSEGVYKLANGAADFTGTISVVNTSGELLGTLTVGETATIGGTEYLLTNENDELSVTVKAGAPVPAKWTYMVYMAADSDISYCALYDIVSMQQAAVDSEIEVYVLADRSTVDNPRNGDYVTPYGTYQWDSLWPDTRVGKITYSPGLTVTVDWESWGELDTGSIATLERFIDWAQEKSPAERYGLIVWDHGRENTTLCFDQTTDPNGEACFTVSELSDFLKEKGNIPLVILNNCMLGSELVVTQMAGSTDVIVVSEPLSYGMSTYNYNAFFNTITADMTAQEMAAIMVQNVESPGIAGVVTMLTSVDVTVSRLAGPLEALAEAIAAAGNAADRTVLINALLKAPQDGCLYDGKKMQQSDLGFLIRDVMADPGYESTSEGFKKSLADVKAALDAIVLEYRGVPSGRGSGITVCNTVCSAENFVGSGNSVEKADSMVKSYIISTYKSNPLWGGLLYDLCSTYLAEIPYESEWSDDVTLDDLTGTKDEVSWKPSAVVPQYIVQFSTDSFEHAFAFETAGTAVDLLGVPAGTYRWRVGVKEEEGTSVPEEWYVGEAFISDNTNENARVFQSKADAIDDLFFATPNGTWSSLYYAKHVGSVGDWSGTGEMVSAAGKGRIQDLFFGSVDPATLCLTDSENGDALFLDDVYTVLPDGIEENTARLLRLQYIKAGAGDDIVDMTSQRFEYAGSKLFIYGGDGDDVIWAGKGRNMLFGDAGNDRIIGASGDDVIVGGIGNDAMHGGGGNDIFTFCENWGADTIEQPAEGSVTLWFLEGSMDNWDAASLTYKDGGNSVTVSGVSAENVTLKFGVEQSEVFVRLYYKNAFAEFASQKIFDDTDDGILASV